ncbi:imidazolonepropionase [Breoghania sp.]|uniref:imidazolonepropionase n=1 Tax=Breoghania sp. TaxID=2065378 RepID=UPI002AA79759|nr:imidazolonepropionase [Breoghania sp.]
MAAGAQALGKVDDGLIAARDGRIVYAGPRADAPSFDKVFAIDCGGRWITPGLVDCHTHLVHGGNRAKEFAMRLEGASYEEIARAGGGIASTVRATREADEAALLEQSLPWLDALLGEGVTTVEVKSGYGLNLADELKALRVARELGRLRDVTVSKTFLGAHAVPPEYAGDREGYLRLVIEEMLPQVAREGLADAVDAFCEGIAFTPDEVARLFEAAAALGLPVKLHADQLSNTHGGELAARFKALSADHMEHADEATARAMGQAGTVAVLLPGAFYFLRETQKPPVDLFRKHGVAMALATDCNPGTSPLTSLLLTMNMAATLFRMPVDECLTAVTRNAAQALGLSQEIGTLEVGKWADLAIWEVDDLAELVYRLGFNPLAGRIWHGR